MEDIKETKEEAVVEDDVTEEQKYVCEKCGKVYEEPRKFCGECGHEIGTSVSTENKKVCKKCGTEYSEGEKFCSVCGEKIDTEKFLKLKKLFNKKYMKYYVISGIVIVILVISSIIIINNNNKKREAELAKKEEESKINLTKIYEEYCDSEWAHLASDGSSLTIDTNPDDSLFNKSEEKATYGFVNVNKALGLPESVIQKMTHTRAVDGIQTASFEGLEISWSYHPDNGMEIIYEVY